MNQRPITSMAVAAIISLLTAAGYGQQTDEVGQIMQAKLGHAQKVLSALATDEPQIIAKHAQELSLLSQAAAWQVLQTPQYQQHSADFRRTAGALTKAAKEKNLDAAALNYVQLTLNCINCHKYVRRVRAAWLTPPGKRVAAETGRFAEDQWRIRAWTGTRATPD